MESRRIGGESGFDITLVGLGCNAFGRRIDQDATTRVIDGALDAGITFFDTAEGYGDGRSEQYIGNALKGRRDQVILATKVGYNMLHVEGKGRGSPENIRVAIDLSLEKLQTDCVDLYQIHRPDPSTPIAETLGAFNDLRTQGKIRLFGCSNYSGEQMSEAVNLASEAGYQGFVTAQNKWNVLQRDIEADLTPVCGKNGIGILPYYPLEMGLLTGKYRRGEGAPPGTRLDGDARLGDANFDHIEALEQFAKSRGYDLITLAVSWLASQKVTASVIAGATRYEQLVQNAEAASWKMTEEDLAEIDRIVGKG
ncbi:MAG: aldo/keto reductase [Rhodospirillaceae bacterium]|nr:aldo/keto reductase [Rhodospirillaceae bacterium]|tara:strand:+ start:10333 stop:11262 length:930 start_codon:yes stop_codon:yes gene_type:complete